MANPMKGEAALGDYTLAFNFGAFIELEERTGLKVPMLLQTLEVGLGFGDLRDFVWAGMRTHHRDVTDEQLVDLLNEQGFEKTKDAVVKGVTSCFAGEKSKDKNPTKSAR